MNASGYPSIPPVNVILLGTVIASPFVVVIELPDTNTAPAVSVFTFKVLEPEPICEAIYALIARCVGKMLSELAVKNGSVENSLIVAPELPTVTEPNCKLCRPAKLNALALSVAVPVDC